jgi:hypothetical protein
MGYTETESYLEITMVHVHHIPCTSLKAFSMKDPHVTHQVREFTV